jgi:tetratricopeptide (TPR) repeat protein
MSYAEYEVIRGTRFEYNRDRDEILDAYPDRFGSPGTDRDLVREVRNQILGRETTAYRDAPPAAGPFPLILFCSGGGDAPYSHDVLFEYLSSHGYVIAAISSQGMYGKAPAYNSMDEESQVRDMEFAAQYTSVLPEVDPLSVCAAGYSYGGLVNVLFALRNFDVDAVLCLDGSICLRNRNRGVKHLPYFSPNRLTSAFMNMVRKPHADQDFSFYEGLKYSDAYLLHFDTLDHAEFTSRPFVGDYSNLLSGKNRNVTRIAASQEIICRFALHFLNAYLKDDPESAAYLARYTEANGMAPESVRIESKKALPYPPKDREFFRLLGEEGVGAAIEVYNRAREIETGVLLFDENDMNREGYAYLNDGRVDEAITLFRLNVDSYPDSWNVYDSLGEAYMKDGQKDLAVENYRKSLAINPRNSNAAGILRKLAE